MEKIISRFFRIQINTYRLNFIWENFEQDQRNFLESHRPSQQACACFVRRLEPRSCDIGMAKYFFPKKYPSSSSPKQPTRPPSIPHVPTLSSRDPASRPGHARFAYVPTFLFFFSFSPFLSSFFFFSFSFIIFFLFEKMSRLPIGNMNPKTPNFQKNDDYTYGM